MTWDAYNRRKSALRDVLDLADRQHLEAHRSSDAPTSDVTPLDVTALVDAVPGARDVFESDAELLLDVQLAWYQRLSGQLDRMIFEGDDPAVVAVEAWASAAADMPGARALLDAHLDRPELARALTRERELLAVSAGVAAHQGDLVAEGERLADQAREQVPAPVVDRPVSLRSVAEARANELIGRLRAAFAA